MMKLQFPTRNLLNPTNPNRIISSNTLHIRHHNSILFSRTYLPRCKLRLNYLISPCQQRFHILYFHSPSIINPNPSSFPSPPYIQTTKPNIPPNQPMLILSTN
uniref:Uncharacterized protein n=1 Tax=Castor canadensis TaxID=51338 RepID=A0A8C0WGW0_CASCN